jgi:hypothetical protein
MGLLDTPKDEALLTLGLGLLNSKGSFGNALGQAGMQSMQVFNQAKDRERVAKMQALQEEMARMNMEQMRRQAEMQRLPQQFLRPQSAPVVDATGGMETAAENPNNDNAGRMDWHGYSQALAGMDPMMALQLQQALKKQRPALQAFKPGDVVGSQDDSGAFREQFRVPDKAANGTSDMQEFAFAQARGEIPKGVSFTDWMRANKKAGASSVSVSTFPPVAGVGPDGKPAFVMIDKATGNPKVVPGVRPPQSATEEKAGQEKVSRERQSKQMLSAMNDAKRILDAGTATASGVGKIADDAARMVGATTKGAQDAARLEALSGWLVANVPRMEGPQSNFDVENYKTMAGKVGDSRIPLAERKAALSEVRKLQQKYSAIDGGAPVQREVTRTGRANGRKVIEYSDGTIEYAD